MMNLIAEYGDMFKDIKCGDIVVIEHESYDGNVESTICIFNYVDWEGGVVLTFADKKSNVERLIRRVDDEDYKLWTANEGHTYTLCVVDDVVSVRLATADEKKILIEDLADDIVLKRKDKEKFDTIDKVNDFLYGELLIGEDFFNHDMRDVIKGTRLAEDILDVIWETEECQEYKSTNDGKETIREDENDIGRTFYVSFVKDCWEGGSFANMNITLVNGEKACEETFKKKISKYANDKKFNNLEEWNNITIIAWSLIEM